MTTTWTDRFTSTSSGAVSRTIAEKLYEMVSVLDYGADPTGTDDCTTAFTNAIAAAKVSGAFGLLVPRGKYRISTGGISLAQIAIYGNGVHEAGTPYNDAGSVLLFESTTTSPFTLGRQVTMEGLSFYWPSQTDANATPTVYPPLFTGTYITQFSFRNNTVVNAYDFLKVTTGSTGIGDCSISNNRIYAINRCFHFQNGAPDSLWITNNMFSWAPYEDVVNAGPNYYLRTYTATSGEFMRIDVGSGSYTLVDGLFLTGNLILGPRYGIRVISGSLNVSKIGQNKFDAVSTWMSVEGTAKLLNSLIQGNYFYCYKTGDATTTYNGMSLTSTGALSDVTVIGNDFIFCRGNHIYWNNLFSDDMSILANRFTSWGQSEDPSVTSYYALQFTDGGVRAIISGNRFSPGGGVVAHLKSGIITGGAVDVFITGNLFSSCYIGVWLTSTLAGKCVVQGNYGSNTVGTQTFRDDVTTAGVVEAIWNTWDKAPANIGFPCFLGTVAAGQTINTGTKTKLNFGTQVYDLDDNYDPSTSTFTAPVAGTYQFEMCVTNDVGVTIGEIWKVAIESAGGSAQSKATVAYVPANAIGAAAVSLSVTLQLSAADTVTGQITRVTGANNYVVANDTGICFFGGLRIQ